MKIYKQSGEFNFETNKIWVGGNFYVPNQSHGYHGLLKQWVDKHKSTCSKWLLVSEKNNVKPFFQREYPNDSFYTTEHYANDDEVDYRYDICDRNLLQILPRFDIIVCQATLEHIYDPFTAVFNMANSLETNGLLAFHTHTPGYPYHAYPRDYIRFYPDWFLDMPTYIKNIELVELAETDDDSPHIFALYKRV